MAWTSRLEDPRAASVEQLRDASQGLREAGVTELVLDSRQQQSATHSSTKMFTIPEQGGSAKAVGRRLPLDSSLEGGEDTREQR